MEVGFRILRQPILACLVFLFSVAVSFRRSAQNSFPPAQVVWYMDQLHIIATWAGGLHWRHVQDGPTRVLGVDVGDVIFTHFVTVSRTTYPHACLVLPSARVDAAVPLSQSILYGAGKHRPHEPSTVDCSKMWVT